MKQSNESTTLTHSYFYRSEAENTNIHIYDGRSDGKPLHTLSKMHSKPVHLIEFNVRFNTVVSVDALGMIEYWSPEEPFGLPDHLGFEMKSQTDLYEFRKVNHHPDQIDDIRNTDIDIRENQYLHV